jgi:hypothetical protein
MQSLENDENSFGEARFDPDSVVGNVEQPVGVLLAAPDLDGRGGFRAKFDGITDEVLEDRAQQRPVA